LKIFAEKFPIFLSTSKISYKLSIMSERSQDEELKFPLVEIFQQLDY
jgi:hypothetical protein